MRQLPATSNSGATSTTESTRSRSHQQSNELSSTKLLTNGAVKEPILTRSKTKLRGGRRLLDRQLKRLLSTSANQHKHLSHEAEGVSKRKQEKGSSWSYSVSSTSPKNHAGANTSSSTINAEKIYARHYKSYRGLNGVKSRRGDSSSAEDDSSCSPPVGHSKEVSRKSNSLSFSGTRNVSTRNYKIRQNGVCVSKGPSDSTLSTVSATSKRRPSRRIRRLMLKRKSQRQQRVSLRRKEKEDVSDDEDGTEVEDKCNKMTSSAISASSPAPRTEEDKGKGEHQNNNTTTNNTCTRVVKRRSALWVLNCEAESFLFGETAAEKHEVELPPLAPPSPPPKKRRWRVNELGALLEKSPGILESKLRKSSSSDSGGDTSRDGSPPRKRLKPNAQQSRSASKRTKTEKEKKTPEMCSSKAVISIVDHQKPQEHEQQQEKTEPVQEKAEEVLSPKPELLSPIPFLYSPDSVDYEAKTVQFQQMLSDLNFGYSFEVRDKRPPNRDGWFRTFERTSDDIIPYTSLKSPLTQSVPLPYEMDKQIRRSRCKPVRNSRKSPRCHASTLAILSSEKPTRSTRSSVTLDNSPSSSVNNLPSEPTLSALLISSSPAPTPTKPPTSALPLSSPTTPATTKLLSPPKYIPPTRRRHLSSSPRPNHTDSKEELGAAQYLWDSIQFLSDPYVVSLLSGDDPEEKQRRHLDPHHMENTKVKTKGLMKNHRCSNNNYVNCNVKHLVKNFETSERKASLRSGGDGTSTNTVNTPQSNLNNSRLVSVPKSSPRNHQSHQCTNHIDGNHISSPPPSPKINVNDHVPAVNGVTRRFKSRSPPLIHPSSKQIHGCHHAHNKVVVSKLSPKNSKGSNTANLNSASKQLTKSTKGSTDSDTSNTTSNGNNGLISNEKSCKKSPVVLVSDLLTTTTKAKLNTWDEESLFISDELPPLPSWPHGYISYMEQLNAISYMEQLYHTN